MNRSIIAMPLIVTPEVAVSEELAEEAEKWAVDWALEQNQVPVDQKRETNGQPQKVRFDLD